MRGNVDRRPVQTTKHLCGTCRAAGRGISGHAPHPDPADAMAAIVLVCIWQAMPDASLAFIAAAAVTLTLSILQDTYNMAFRDDLTGLQSRRALNEQLMGLGRQYVVAMVDVDHFKRFNDTFGHDVGDQVLKMVATKIQGVMGGGK